MLINLQVAQKRKLLRQEGAESDHPDQMPGKHITSFTFRLKISTMKVSDVCGGLLGNKTYETF